ncbi:hypothetical protein [Actinoplanes auranticolor]|uniref:Uncharacterized protein n=1 Tax=Actinoplanes auranticolor TaxID=47988 RepID=A0A919SP28_9ACTN|nr:hypothetical protein [Actinoplanes auranticolor]GIM74927.1 hypothetical protein Aau02nite_63350 [Actinoplanes auranticolor]
MNFPAHDTLAGYARTAVDLRSRMADYHRSPLSHDWLNAFMTARSADTTQPTAPKVLDAVRQITSLPWQGGQPYVVAPAMTAVIAAAAQALDLTGEVLPNDIAPDDSGVLLLPEPVYQRTLTGTITSIGAITWAKTTTVTTGASSWFICGWADHHDPLDPAAARRREQVAARPDLTRQFGPYVLITLDQLPIGRPVDPPPDQPVIDDADIDWQNAPDGRYVLDEAAMRTKVSAALVYAFWRIQAQPLATVATAPADRATRRRAVRASIRHDTRVVMLRRTKPLAEPGDGDPKWHYRVRFFVRGHWRRLIDRDGIPYRIWINAHIKGPDGAPLMLGEKVAVLAR